MSFDPQDPPRLLARGPSAEADVVRSLRGLEPGEEAVRRMAKRLAEAGALASPAPSREPLAAAFGSSSSKVALIAVLVVGGAGVWRTTRREVPVVTAPASVQAASYATSEQATPISSVASPTFTMDQLPSATDAPSPSVARKTPSAGAQRVKAKGASELELLQRAQAALAIDPARALATTVEQARAYPSGEFAQEREVVAIEALARLGRRQEALERARTLVRQYPTTPYSARLERAVGGTL